MYLSTLFLTVLATLTHSATIPKRQLELPNGQTVKQDILNIHNAVLALDTTIQAYQGVPLPTSLVEGTPVLLGVAEIHKVNRAGFRHALASMQFSVEDSREVIESVVDTVNISIPAATEHLKGKVEAFKEGGLIPVVIASLGLLLSDHDTFSAATLLKIDQAVGPEEVKRGENAVANIHEAIQGAIVFYSANIV